MPFIPHTPESLLPRSDSKNPAATCRGLTANGRSCRRSISKSPQVSPISSPRRQPSPKAFCWQHKEQATPRASPTPKRNQPTIHERTSIDTLVDRLGLLEAEKKEERKQRRIPVAQSNLEKPPPRIDHPMSRPKPRPQQRSDFGLLCCFGTPDETKRAPRPVVNKPGRRTTVPVPPKHSKVPANVQSHRRLSRPPIERDPSSRTGEFLTLIPNSASPQTTSLLLAELAKPFSEHDDEGFIYMFWLTPESLPSDPPAEAASTLLAPPSRPVPGKRRTSDVLTTFASSQSQNGNKKMLLKIGRAANVQRRLNQWTRQCGYNLSLIRYYPYHSTTLSESDARVSRTPRKVPNANRVERLIHIELNGRRAMGNAKCSACGKEHREWFEVEASRDGVRSVDEVIRRWISWGEREGEN